MKIHPTTGEVLDPAPTKDSRPYVYLYVEGIDKILAAPMRPTDYRVLFAVWLRAPLDGYAWDTAAGKVAEQLEIAPTEVHRSLRHLVEMGLLERPIRGKVAFVRSVAWRGRTAL